MQNSTNQGKTVRSGERYRDLKDKIAKHNSDVDNLLIKWETRLDSMVELWYASDMTRSLVSEFLADLRSMSGTRKPQTDFIKRTVTNDSARQ